MANNVQIYADSTQIAASAAQIASRSAGLNQDLYDMKKDIERIINHWDSPAGEEFAKSFQMIIPDFENASKFITRYANFLEVVAETYEETEKRITKGSSSFSG